jgi:hypothetical protein
MFWFTQVLIFIGGITLLFSVKVSKPEDLISTLIVGLYYFFVTVLILEPVLAFILIKTKIIYLFL